ncbi:HAD-superfamily subfamily IIA hydrolase like protein [Methylobacterium nodulans ORS 2060]|uniref:HAD-superfamily subfamily IIA hydrolase like protein n=1 Tax=Methylobacterium nodulans (strain LMG 21967 / CNCM I-2342 / ORS 2060) TaxID=460265 RepID=B8INN4_METNO|nr:HAD-superfamily subfamily IIA hydrolase like protein [Methylobacterium nodulans ORS 2060]
MGGLVPVPGLRGLSDRYPLLLCDVFGVLHDATRVFPEALAALRAHRAAGGTVILASNAPDPGPHLARRLAAKGIAEVCDGIVSAGDVARAFLREQEPGTVLHLGTESDRILFEGLPCRLATGGEEPDLIACTGYPDEDHELDACLRDAVSRGLLLLCTNPDLQATVGARTLRFAGLVAARYRALGGVAVETGKPGAFIYRHALAVAAETAGRSFRSDEVLGLGDTPALDLAGALSQGFAALHVGPDPDGAFPLPDAPGRLYSLPTLRWEAALDHSMQAEEP